MRKTVLIITFAAVSGCASAPSKQEAGAGEYGEYPKNYPEIVKSHYQAIVAEPGAIRFNVIHVPRLFALSEGMSQARYGYLVCADLNLKQSSGEYTGHHTDGLLIHDGRIVQFIERGHWLGKSVC